MAILPINDIDYVLLDLDGTLLDKYFDDHFWLHLVPERYAELHGLPLDKSKEHLFKTYKSQEGTLNWTDLDFWSRELDLDIPVLKEQLVHLIDVHPHVEDFLRQMRSMGKPIHLVTNAHHKSIQIKFRKTGIGEYFQSVLTSNELGFPKEDQGYWIKAHSMIGFDRERTVFVDDTEAVLHSAHRFGIKYPVFKGRSSSREEVKRSQDFISITDFNDLMV